MKIFEKIGLMLFILGAAGGGSSYVPSLNFLVIVIGAFMFLLFSEDIK